MLVVTRYRVPEAEAAAFLAAARGALATFAGSTGHLRGRVGRSTDDPELWLLTLEWESIGAYRRALSAYEVRVSAIPLLSRALDEPSAFEVLVDSARATDGRPRRAADADTVALGEASAPAVPTGFEPADEANRAAGPTPDDR